MQWPGWALAGLVLQPFQQGAGQSVLINRREPMDWCAETRTAVDPQCEAMVWMTRL